MTKRILIYIPTYIGRFVDIGLPVCFRVFVLPYRIAVSSYCYIRILLFICVSNKLIYLSNRWIVGGVSIWKYKIEGTKQRNQKTKTLLILYLYLHVYCSWVLIINTSSSLTIISDSWMFFLLIIFFNERLALRFWNSLLLLRQVA